MEGDADGDDQVIERKIGKDVEGAQRSRQRGREEVEILVSNQRAGARRDADAQPGLARARAPASRDAQSYDVAGGGQCQNQQHVQRLPAHVKVVTAQQQKQPAQAIRQREVDHHAGNVEDQKMERVEEHLVYRPLFSFSCARG